MSDVFDPPQSTSPAARRAGETALMALLVTSTALCCFPLVLASPVLGGMALWQLHDAPIETDADAVWARVAQVGGWTSLLVGGLYVLFMLAYVAFLVVAIAAGGALSESMNGL